MVIAYHLIFTLYGWWLPNDPRGSTSRYIQSDLIAELGALHFGRKRVQPSSRQIREFYEQAAGRLQYELLTLDDAQIERVADGFGDAIACAGYTCYACAVMPDHAHVLIRRHKDRAEEMTEMLQKTSARVLIEAGFRRADHPVWGGPGWKVYLDTPDDISRTIRYVAQNPIKQRRPAQH